MGWELCDLLHHLGVSACYFKSEQHLRSYQEGYRIVTVRIHGCFYSAAPLGYRTTSTVIGYPTESHYSDTELTTLCLILIMPITWLGSDKYQLYKSLVWLDWGSKPRSPAREARAIPIGPPRPVDHLGEACSNLNRWELCDPLHRTEDKWITVNSVNLSVIVTLVQGYVCVVKWHKYQPHRVKCTILTLTPVYLLHVGIVLIPSGPLMTLLIGDEGNILVYLEWSNKISAYMCMQRILA